MYPRATNSLIKLLKESTVEGKQLNDDIQIKDIQRNEIVQHLTVSFVLLELVPIICKRAVQKDQTNDPHCGNNKERALADLVK